MSSCPTRSFLISFLIASAIALDCSKLFPERGFSLLSSVIDYPLFVLVVYMQIENVAGLFPADENTPDKYPCGRSRSAVPGVLLVRFAPDRRNREFVLRP